MEGMQRAMKWWCILLVVQVGESQFCPGTADTFVSLPRIVGARKEDLVSFPSNEVSLGEWIFPSFSFQCSGRISGWIFRAEPGVDLASIDRVPQWSIYRDQPVTPLNMLDFEVIRSIGEVEETRDPGVYRYTLNSTMDVQMGDFVGVSYENSEDSQPTNLRLSFLNVSIDGRETPISFRRQDFSASVFFIVNPKTTENVTGYMPLVTPIIAEPSTTTRPPSPPSPPDPTVTTTTQPLISTPETPRISTPPTRTMETSTSTEPTTATASPTFTEPPTATATAATLPITATTSTELPTSTEPPTAASMLPITATTSTEPPTATDPPVTTNVPEATNPRTLSESIAMSTPTNPTESDPQAASGASLGVIVGTIAGVVVVLVMVVVVVCVLVLMKRRKHKFKVRNSQFVSPLENPVYQVNTGTLEEDKRASLDPDYATLKASQPNHTQLHHNGRVPLSRLALEDNSVSITGNSVSVSPYEVPAPQASQQFNPSSVVYYEVGPLSASDVIKEAQDYDLPVTSTLDYEVPVSSNPSTVGDRGDHEYRVLEQGIYVPTIGEREQYLSNIEAASVDSSTLDQSIYSRISENYRGQLQRAGFFLEDEVYWPPASSKKALYDQLSRKKYREILRQQIKIQKHLGSGQFGMVNMGEWLHFQGVTQVAVKTLVPGSNDDDKVKFLQEAAIMGQFIHPNVVRLYGVVTVGEPVMIVLEYMQKGDLRNYLLARQPEQGQQVDRSLPHQLLKFCREIADGMDYLSSKSFVHRDLAARNILIGADTTCKIGDFGMSRNLEDSNYYITHGGRIPVKWTAPEALNYRKYSTASDVWSFGAVMYEMWSLGQKPFEGYTNAQTMDMVVRGFRLPPPPGCPRALYELMIRCWHSEPVRRPVFFAVKKMLSHSDSQLLSWSSKDLSVHPLVSVLGAARGVAEDLYQELQDYYLNK